MNRLYWQCLSENTTSPFELIIIDNHSTDGSEKFFSKLPGVVYLRNEFNRSYPASQNQGMKAAKYETLCFLNNDLWLPKGWNEPFEKALSENPYLVLSPSGQEAQPSQQESDKLKQRWKVATLRSKIWKALFLKSEEARLWKSLEWMYGNLDPFQSPTRLEEKPHMNGIKGDVVVFHKKLLEIAPSIWDERIQAADWHLYLTMASLHEKDPSIPLPRVLLNSYIHHFGRYSARQKYEPLKTHEPFLEIEDVWGKATVDRLWWGNKLPATPSQ